MTNIGAKLARSVALATEVNLIDVCQKAKSPAKKNPAKSSERISAADCGLSAECLSRLIHNHKIGKAKTGRQKAVAVGPISDKRTKIGASPIAAAPINKAASANVDEEVGVVVCADMKLT